MSLDKRTHPPQTTQKTPPPTPPPQKNPIVLPPTTKPPPPEQSYKNPHPPFGVFCFIFCLFFLGLDILFGVGVLILVVLFFRGFCWVFFRFGGMQVGLVLVLLA